MKDLTNILTVFVIDGGNNPNIGGCLKALQNQSCKFKIDIIKDYSPMSKAFQEMLNRCTTPYYIQCDSDMVLNGNAVEAMYNDIAGEKHDTMIAMHCYMLKDTHLSMDIYGVKIYKYEIFKNYAYNQQHPSCEVEQLDRLQADGYKYTLFPIVMGEHSPLWNNELIFERYYNLMEKFKLFHYMWMEKLPSTLWEKIKKDPSDQNMYAFLGAMSSIFSDKIMNEEKSLAIKRKDYGRILSYFEEPHQLTLYMSGDCNYKCDFCVRQHQGIICKKDMTLDMTKIAIHKFPSIKGVCLCGFGETLLNKELIPILQYLKSAKKYIGVITNGSLLKKRLPEMLGWFQPDYISISLNAHTKEEHERITHTQTWDTVLEGIQACLNTSIELYVSHVVSTENIDSIPDFLKFVKSLGIKTVHLHNILPHFDEAYNENFWNLVLMPEHQKKIDELKKLPEANIVKKWPTLIDKSGGKKACQFPWYSFSVDAEGNVSICNSVLPTSNEKFGNINDFSFWNSEKLKKFRDDYCNNNLPACSKCFRNWSFI